MSSSSTSNGDSSQKVKEHSINMPTFLKNWKGRTDFLKAQAQVAAILLLAWLGNNFPKAYPRNDNHNMVLFWLMNAVMLVAAIATLKHEPNARGGVQPLSRAQTEEWKGWMQWMFIMYHYYRAYSVYNEIRTFVSAYVWMTGFGNFLYFDKKQDFSVDRAISMWLRINYFPILLSVFLGVKLELYYVVPLHTTAFFITMATCYVAKLLGKYFWSNNKTKCNVVAIGLCLLVHVLFYETPAVNFLLLFSKEYHFRFQSDKYSPWVGILSGFCWGYVQEYMTWCYTTEGTKQQVCQWVQRIGGVGLMLGWYFLFGFITDKFVYNPIHPYVFFFPVAGWLMVRNSSKYLTELHSTGLEFFGRITLETYVLQFHLFMCRDVQYIPIVIPGSGPEGHIVVKTLNMLLCGVIFVYVAHWARQVTVTTQTTVTELMHSVLYGEGANESEMQSLKANEHDHPRIKAKTSDLGKHANVLRQEV